MVFDSETLRRRRSGAESILSHRIYHITVTGKRIDIFIRTYSHIVQSLTSHRQRRGKRNDNYN